MSFDDVMRRDSMGLPRGWFFYEVFSFDIVITASVSGVWTATSAEWFRKAGKNELSKFGSTLRGADDDYHLGFLPTGAMLRLETTTFVPTGSPSVDEVLTGLGAGWTRATQPGVARNDAFFRANGCWISFPDSEFERRAVQCPRSLLEAMLSVKDKVGKHIVEYDGNIAKAIQVGS